MKGHITSRLCCCGIPINIGAGAVATSGLVMGLLFVIADGFVANKYDADLTPSTRLVVYLHGFVFAIFVAFSFVGLLAVFRHSKRLATLHFSAGLAHIPFSIATGAALLQIAFRTQKPNLTMLCRENANQDQQLNAQCHRQVTALQGTLVATSMVVWLFQLGGAFVNNAYVKQLSEVDRKRAAQESFYYE